MRNSIRENYSKESGYKSAGAACDGEGNAVKGTEGLGRRRDVV